MRLYSSQFSFYLRAKTIAIRRIHSVEKPIKRSHFDFWKVASEASNEYFFFRRENSNVGKSSSLLAKLFNETFWMIFQHCEQYLEKMKISWEIICNHGWNATSARCVSGYRGGDHGTPRQIPVRLHWNQHSRIHGKRKGKSGWKVKVKFYAILIRSFSSWKLESLNFSRLSSQCNELLMVRVLQFFF